MRVFRVSAEVPASVHLVYEIKAKNEYEALRIAGERLANRDEDFEIGEGGTTIDWDHVYANDVDYAEEVEA